MPAYRQATVAELLDQRPGLVRVRLDDGSRAYGLTQLTGPVGVGDEVVVNTTAVDLGLGSGIEPSGDGGSLPAVGLEAHDRRAASSTSSMSAACPK